MNQLRSYMFHAVYNSKVVKAESEMEKIRNLIFRLYDYYLAHPDLLPDELARLIEKDGVEEVVKDHVAGMTDRYAINDFTRIFVPTGWTGVPEKF